MILDRLFEFVVDGKLLQICKNYFFLSTTPIAIYSGKTHRLMYANNAFMHRTGYELKTLQSKDIPYFVIPEDREDTKREAEEVFDGYVIKPSEIRFYTNHWRHGQDRSKVIEMNWSTVAHDGIFYCEVGISNVN